MVWQSYENIMTYVSYPTAQGMSSKHLLDAGFPKIEICISPGFDLNYLENMGYRSLYNFAQGKGKLNDQLFYGWNGNINIGLEQFFENAFMFKNFSSIISSIYLKLDNKATRNLMKITERKFRYPDGKCFDIKMEIDADLYQQKVLDLQIFFNQLKEVEVNIKITDPNREYFMSDSFTFSGNEIKKNLDPEHKTSFDIYRVQIHEYDELEEDEEANCKTYGKDKNQSFKQCVQSFVENKFVKEFGCLPPWFSENVEVFCSTSYTTEKWRNMSTYIFPTMDNTFLEVRNKCKVTVL
jgi:hypothetical protein